jgi:hypothetical protein
MADEPAVLAVSDLHVEHEENREVVDGLRPETDGGWLIVCGDASAPPRVGQTA